MNRIGTAKQAIRRIWSFTRALDLALVDDEVRKGFQLDVGYHHGERVGYISARLGYLLGLRGIDLFLLLLSGLLHDIGAVGGFASYHGDPKLMTMHSELGAKILGNFPSGDILSESLRYHHQTPWNHQKDFLPAKIISLADKVDIVMGRKIHNYQERAKVANYVNSLVGKEFYPDVAEAFLQLVGEEAFWLYLDEGELLEPTLHFLFRTRGDEENSELGEVCREMAGEPYTVLLAETFAFLIDQKSVFTGYHSRSVAEVAADLAEGLGWEAGKCRKMRLAGLLHDLGKLAVPEKILDKPGSLDQDEIQTIRTHTYHTYNLLSAAGFPGELVEWASFHHERLDGRGYPFRINRDSLSVGSRLMTIADMYTALTEDRPYRQGLTKEKAMEIIAKGCGSSVDEELVKAAGRILL